MAQDAGINNGNCEEHLLKPIASQLAADRLPADYQQATGQLPTSYGRVIDSWSVFWSKPANHLLHSSWPKETYRQLTDSRQTTNRRSTDN